jgi:hypothetical protein
LFAGRYCNIEDIPAAGYSADDGLRVIPKGTPDLNQALHKGVVGYKSVSPDCTDDLFLAQETPVILSQEPQHFEGLWPQLEVRPVPSQASTRKIDDKALEP